MCYTGFWLLNIWGSDMKQTRIGILLASLALLSACASTSLASSQTSGAVFSDVVEVVASDQKQKSQQLAALVARQEIAEVSGRTATRGASKPLSVSYTEELTVSYPKPTDLPNCVVTKGGSCQRYVNPRTKYCVSIDLLGSARLKDDSGRERLYRAALDQPYVACDFHERVPYLVEQVRVSIMEKLAERVVHSSRWPGKV